MAYRYYAVAVGREKGIYESWQECKEQVEGFSNALFKGFDDLAEAEAFVEKRRVFAYVGSAKNTFPPEDETQTQSKKYTFGLIIRDEDEIYFYDGLGDVSELDDVEFNDYKFIGADVVQAMRYAIRNNKDVLHVYFEDAAYDAVTRGPDYENYLFQEYYEKYQEALRYINIIFEKYKPAEMLEMANNIARNIAALPVNGDLPNITGRFTADLTSPYVFDDDENAFDDYDDEYEDDGEYYEEDDGIYIDDDFELPFERVIVGYDQNGNPVFRDEETDYEEDEYADEDEWPEDEYAEDDEWPEEEYSNEAEYANEYEWQGTDTSKEKENEGEQEKQPESPENNDAIEIDPNTRLLASAVLGATKTTLGAKQEFDDNVRNCIGTYISKYGNLTKFEKEEIQANRAINFFAEDDLLLREVTFFWQGQHLGDNYFERNVSMISLSLTTNIKVIDSTKAYHKPYESYYAMFNYKAASGFIDSSKLSFLRPFVVSLHTPIGDFNLNVRIDEHRKILGKLFCVDSDKFNYGVGFFFGEDLDEDVMMTDTFAHNIVNANLLRELFKVGHRESVAYYIKKINEADSKNPIIIPEKIAEKAIGELATWLDKRDSGVPEEDMPMLPSLVFLGEPGTGKTEMAERIAKEVLGARFKAVTPADFKAPYIGHTGSKVTDIIEDLQKECINSTQPAVLFIDEAYGLFPSEKNGKGDAFAADAIGALLPVLSKRPCYLDYPKIKGGNKDEERHVYVRKNFTIWLAGYEKETRRALSSNQGMFRRFESIVLPTPTNEELWNSLVNKWNDNSVKRALHKKKEDILDYFRWACSKTYSEYFGNYAGVIRFMNACQKRMTMLSNVPSEQDIIKVIDDTIKDQKEEIRRQYICVIESKRERIPFAFATDIQERLTEEYYIGNSELKGELIQVIEMLLRAEEYEARKINPPKGAILMGPPGTGKTYIARCMAGELEAKLKELDIQKNVGFVSVPSTKLNTAEDVQMLFSASEEYDITIIFIDEIDIIGMDRNMSNNTAPLFQLLDSLDGFDKKKNIFVLAATNNPDVIDDALIREGRFDRKYEVTYPDTESRKKLVELYLMGDKVSDDCLEKMSKLLKGCSPAAIKSMLNDARLNYYTHIGTLKTGDEVSGGKSKLRRAGKVSVTAIDEAKLIEELDEVIELRESGRARKNDKSEGPDKTRNDGLWSTAVHEVGHALMHVLNGNSFEKITVVGRGDFGGYVSSENKSRTKADFIKSMKVSLGGRAAEEVIYGVENVSYGAMSDIRSVTEQAKKMIMLFGMDEEIGMFASLKFKSTYLGSSFEFTGSPQLQRECEESAMNLIKELYEEVVNVLSLNKDAIEKLADVVYEKEVMSGEEFSDTIKELGIELKK